MGQTHRIAPSDLSPSDRASPGAYLTSLIATSGDGTKVFLAQGTEWDLEDRILVQAPNVLIATDGFPTDVKKYAKIRTAGPSQSTAIHANEQARFTLSHVLVDGTRDERGHVEKGDALVSVGGRGGLEPVIESCVLRDPRGWSCLHVFDHCQRARVVNNKVGPAGQSAPKGPWADGLSIACRDGIIANNEIVDATDGAIVLFCAPGTLCFGNTIINRDRDALGGINMVDPFPYDQDYTDTRVFNNTIRTEGKGYIKLGIGIGETCWAPKFETLNRGGSVRNNVIGPGTFGYGIGASGLAHFTILDNRVSSTGRTLFQGDLSHLPEPLNSPPVAFLRSSDPNLASLSTNVFQDDFVAGRAVWLIGIERGRSRRMRFDGPTVRLSPSLPGWDLKGVSIGLTGEGEVRIVQRRKARRGQLVWSSGTGRAGAEDPALVLSKEGALEVRERGGEGGLIWSAWEWLGGTAEEGKVEAEIPERLRAKERDVASVTISDRRPYLSVWSRRGDLVWATDYVFPKGQFAVGVSTLSF